MNLIENEIAKEIEDYEDYFITTGGRVWSTMSSRWLKGKCDRRYCRVGFYKNEKRIFFLVHRVVALAFIPNPDGKQCVDHVDGNPLNNNIENLRWVTSQENNFNAKIKCNNITGVKGVHFRKQSQKWCARISINGKQTHIGYFNTIEEATHARRTKAHETQGEFMHSCEK